MLRFYFWIFIALLTNTTSYAQQNQEFTIFYAKDSSSIIKLDDDFKTVFVFSYPKNQQLDEGMPLKLSLHNSSIIVPTTIERAKDKRSIVFGALPVRLFDASLEGHIDFGKTLFRALDSVDKDSIVTVSTKAMVNGTVSGPLHLDFKNWPGLYSEFWKTIEYYVLLEDQIRIQDAIEKTKADITRGQALVDASKRYVEASSQKIKDNENELSRKYSQFSATFESLKSINRQIDESFEITRTGQTLSEEDQRKIAYLTADGSKLKKELKQSSNGKFALQVFETMSKAMTQHRNAQKQHEEASNVLNERETSLKAFEKELKRINKRLEVLKTQLKL